MDVEPVVRGDNSGVVGHARPINAVPNARNRNSFLLSNRECLNSNRRVALYHTPRTISIADGSAQSTSRRKLLTFLTKNTTQTVSGGSKDVLRKF